MPYRYHITVQRLFDASDESGTRDLTFDVANHDEIIQLVERVKARALLPEGEAAEFTVGLKLFAEVMLRHRKQPLFAELLPQFGVFMKRLKNGSSEDAINAPAL